MFWGKLELERENGVGWFAARKRVVEGGLFLRSRSEDEKTEPKKKDANP